MLSSVAPQVARETDSCEKVQGTRRDVHASPGAGDGQRGGEDSPPREQFYRNEISNCFSLSCPSSRSNFRANFVIILEIYFDGILRNSVYYSSLHFTWKNYFFNE